MTLAHSIEAILLFKNEPMTLKELSKLLDADVDSIRTAIDTLQQEYAERGIVIITDGESVSFGTHPEAHALIEKIQKDELSRELGRAGLETLAIVLYKGPISRREIDFIRGVNSGFILRNLLIRGLIERTESTTGERSFSYRPTLEALKHLGITRREELPNFDTAFKKLEDFAARQSEQEFKETNA